MIRLTELKGTRAKKKTIFNLEETDKYGLRKLVAAVICRDSIDESGEDDAVAGDQLQCDGVRSESWCRAMGQGIEDFLRLGDFKIKIRSQDVQILRKAVEVLDENNSFFKKGSKKREMPNSDYMKMLNGLRPLDELWEVCADTIKISGSGLDRNEMVNLIDWLSTCRGGFILNEY